MPPHKSTSRLIEIDPRIKLGLCLSLSMGVMFGTPSLVLLLGATLLLAICTGVAGPLYRMCLRLTPGLVVIFALDWWVVDLEFAVMISLRIMLLSLSFVVFTCSTSRGDVLRTLRWLRIPRGWAFGLAVAMQSTEIMRRQWQAVREAQRVRGLATRLQVRRLSDLRNACRMSLPLLVPMVVLSVRRAWHQTEAAVLRGFGAPGYTERVAFRLRGRDHVTVVVWTMVLAVAILLEVA